MKKFLRNRKLLVTLFTFVFSIILITISVSLRNSQSSPSFIQKFNNDTISIVGKVVDWPVTQIGKGVKRIDTLMKTYQENDHLKKQVDDLAQTKVRNSTLEDENRQLKNTLKLRKTLSDYDLVEGSVISRTPDSWSDVVLIDQGSNSGIKKNMAVASGNGLVGRVIEVNHTSSKVELLTTSDKSAARFSVEGKIGPDEYIHGIVNGYDGRTGNLLLSQVEDGKKIKPGTKIYTSGLGGQSPKGILVGTVKKTSKDSFGLSNIVQIKPATNLNNFTIVTVILRKVAGE